MRLITRGGFAALAGLAGLAFAAPALADGPVYKHGRYHGAYGHYGKHYKHGYHRYPRGRVVYHNHNDGKGLAVAAGVIAGAVILDAVLDSRAQAASPNYVAYGQAAVPQPVAVYPAPAPRAVAYQPAPYYENNAASQPQPYVAPTPYYENNAPPAPAPTAAPGSYERAYSDCAVRARSVAAQQGAASVFVSDVTDVQQLPDGAFEISGFLSTDTISGSFARRFTCVSDASGVRELSID